jgi:IS5 family transposase
MGAADQIIDSRAFSDFCGIESSNQVPDGDTIGRFRKILVENGIQEQLFAQVTELLAKRMLILKKGTIVDSSIISAPTSTKNADRKRDPEAASTKKGSALHFGYKAHIGVDSESGLVHHVAVTPANEHDVTVAHRLMTGEEETVYGDSGYLGMAKREEAITRNNHKRKIKFKINRRPSQLRKLSRSGQYKAKQAERVKSSVRAKVEHVFGVVKGLFGYRKTRYRGLVKQTSKLYMMFTLANLYLAGRRVSPTRV